MECTEPSRCTTSDAEMRTVHKIVGALAGVCVTLLASCEQRNATQMFFLACNVDGQQDRYVGIRVARRPDDTLSSGWSSIDFQHDGLMLRVPPVWWTAPYSSVTAMSFTENPNELSGTLNFSVEDANQMSIQYSILDMPSSCWQATQESLKRWDITLGTVIRPI